MRVGDAERQAPIRVALIGVVHPDALDGRRTDLDLVAVDHIGGELHGAIRLARSV